jgi:hypothetical protein
VKPDAGALLKPLCREIRLEDFLGRALGYPPAVVGNGDDDASGELDKAIEIFPGAPDGTDEPDGPGAPGALDGPGAPDGPDGIATASRAEIIASRALFRMFRSACLNSLGWPRRWKNSAPAFEPASASAFEPASAPAFTESKGSDPFNLR